MSISTLGLFNTLGQANQATQNRINDLDRQISGGKKGTVYGDYGATDSRISLGIRPAIDRFDVYQRSISVSKSRTAVIQTALNGINELGRSVAKELTTALGATKTDTTLTNEVARKALYQLADLLNGKSESGYLFSGVQTGEQPISVPQGVDALIKSFASYLPGNNNTATLATLSADYDKIIGSLDVTNPGALQTPSLVPPLVGLYNKAILGNTNSVSVAVRVDDGQDRVIYQPPLYNNGQIVRPQSVAPGSTSSTTTAAIVPASLDINTVTSPPILNGQQLPQTIQIRPTDTGPVLSVGGTVTLVGTGGSGPITLQGTVSGFDQVTGNFSISLAGGNPPANVTGVSGFNISQIPPTSDLRADSYAFRQLFKSLLIAATATYPANNNDLPAWRNLIQGALSSLNTSLDGIADQAGNLGTTEAAINSTSTRLDQTQKYFQTLLGDAEDVDVADAISRLQLAQTQLQASYRVTAKLQDLTLLNFLR